MRYIIRSIKYFIYFTLLLVVMLTALRLLHMTGDATDIPSMFKDGYNSLLYIALMFAGVIVSQLRTILKKHPTPQAQ